MSYSEEEIKKLLELPKHLDEYSEKKLDLLEPKYQCAVCEKSFSRIHYTQHVKSCQKEQEVVNYCKNNEFTVEELMEKYNLCLTTIHKILNSNNLITPNQGKSIDDKNKFLECYSQNPGISINDIVEKTGIERKRVQNYFKEFNLKKPARKKSKEAQVLHDAVQKHYYDGTNPSIKEIADRTGLHPKSISNYYKRHDLVCHRVIKIEKRNNHIIHLHKKGQTDIEIAKQVGTSNVNVFYVLKKAGFK